MCIYSENINMCTCAHAHTITHTHTHTHARTFVVLAVTSIRVADAADAAAV